VRTSFVTRARDRLACRLPDSKAPVAVATLVAVAVAAVIGARGLLFAPPRPEDIDARRNPFPPTAGSLAIGERVYRAYCQTCHGVDGRGDGP
jgi:mono/diheme cytochrome c family protein